MLPNQRGGAALRDQIDSTDGVPGWLAGLHHSGEAILSHGGNAPSITLVAVMALVGLVGLAGRPWRMAAAAAGALAAAAFWILGQNIGQLYSGQATDPNTGPLIVLMAFALAGSTRSLALPTNTRSPSTPISTAGIYEHREIVGVTTWTPWRRLMFGSATICSQTGRSTVTRHRHQLARLSQLALGPRPPRDMHYRYSSNVVLDDWDTKPDTGSSRTSRSRTAALRNPSFCAAV